MRERQFTDCVDIVGSSCKPFEGNRRYISTGAVATDHIDESDVEIVDYKSRPSRADLVVEPETLLFAKMQGTKKTLYVDKENAENIYSTGFFALKAKSGVISTRCLYHLLGSASFLTQKDKNCSGATQKAITNAGLKKIRVSIPDYQLQEAIADQLDKISSVIQMRRSELQKLDDLVKARFVEMFGDPVDNSKHFDLVPLGQLGVLKRGVSKHRPRNDAVLLGGNFPLIQTGDVSNAKDYITEYTSTYSEEGLKQSKMWGKGTLCITIAANIADTAILNFDACFPDSVVGFIPNEKVTTLFIHNWFKFLQPVLEENAPAVAQKNLNVATLEKTGVIVPPIEMQNEFEIFVQQIDKSKFVESIHVLKLIKEAIAKEVSHDRIR